MTEINVRRYDCIYREDCNVPEMVICRGEFYKNCLVYKRRKILDKPKLLRSKNKKQLQSQLEKFMERYPMWRFMNIGSKK